MAMVSLARTPESTMPEPASVQTVQPSYPYGCCISLDDQCLKAMGLEGDLPAPGETIHFEAVARVTCASIDPVTDKPRVELQITDMGMIGAEPEPRAKKWYGEHDEPDGDEE